MRKTAVIGGGPAGMMAAFAAAKTDAVDLYEKNEKLGKKLYLTGKGRCNLSNTAEREEFLQNVMRNPRFLYGAFSRFSNRDLVALLETHGLPTKVERGGRVFPVSDKSSDVIKTLSGMLGQAGASVFLHTHVDAVLIENGRVLGLRMQGKTYPYDKVILATGGLSYPATGSNGEGYEMARAAGHTIRQPRPSLIPLVARDAALCRRLTGISLRNVTLSFYEKGKKRYEELGEMLFTHFGLSGPLVLSASAHIEDYAFCDTLVLLDLKPGLDAQKLDKRMLRDFSENSNKELKNALFKLFPRALCPEVVLQAGLDGEKAVHAVTREERRRLIAAIKAFRVPIEGTRCIDEAIITRGGVEVKEVDPSTMQSKLVKGLYFAGEMLDLDACTGGYNLQIAFSTGYLAGLGVWIA